jgi:hypothetical protein
MALVVTNLLEGQSTKLYAADTTQFLRAALAAIAAPNSRETMSMIGVDKGFAWILPPPPDPVRPKAVQSPGVDASQAPQGERPADAPSLLKH